MKQARSSRTNNNINSVAPRRTRSAKRPSTLQPGRSARILGSLVSTPEPDPASESQRLHEHWRSDPRWQGVTRPYSAEDVLRLRGTLKIEHTVADQMSRKLWRRLHTEAFVPALGALTGNQAVQMAQAG